MYNPAMDERMQTALDRSRNRPELNRERPDPPKIAMKEKLEGETESQYVERLTAEYKAKMSDATPPALFKRAVTFIQAMARCRQAIEPRISFTAACGVVVMDGFMRSPFCCQSVCGCLRTRLRTLRSALRSPTCDATHSLQLSA